MEEEAASEVEAEDEVSEADASKCFCSKTIFGSRYCELAWRWWYGVQPWTVSVCNCFDYKIAWSKFQRASLRGKLIDDAHVASRQARFWDRVSHGKLQESLRMKHRNMEPTIMTS